MEKAERSEKRRVLLCENLMNRPWEQLSQVRRGVIVQRSYQLQAMGAAEPTEMIRGINVYRSYQQQAKWEEKGVIM